MFPDLVLWLFWSAREVRVLWAELRVFLGEVRVLWGEAVLRAAVIGEANISALLGSSSATGDNPFSAG